ncbi:MAG: endonuclease/exonuclease/phosphatase family protein [Candidatus Sumerlaeaceae bacterium]
MFIVEIILAVAAVWLISGTLLNFSKHPHWYIRAWDFPRTLTAIVAACVAILYAGISTQDSLKWLLLSGLAFVITRQLYMIYPYTPAATKTVQQSTKADDGQRLRILISNVLQNNREYDKWLAIARTSDPDIIVALETDQCWTDALQSLDQHYPHKELVPLDNTYGMIFYSRLEFITQPEVCYVVQQDVPSIHATLRLRDNHAVDIHALHPRPPEPVNAQDSAPRDAELVILGRQIGEREREQPTIVCGDLNDVAWSYTTQLFLRLSKLLDPRMGRGLFSSFNANSRIFRWPLDHVFHSNEFKLVELRILGHVGSDHFPVLIELSCEPEARMEQQEPDTHPEDHLNAQEMVEEQLRRETEGKEEGHLHSKSS